MNRKLLLLATAIIATGCGGGGGSTPTQDQIFGPFQTRAAGGTPQSLTQSLGGATVTGVAGASFSKINFAPQPHMAPSRLVFIRGGGQSALYVANHDGSNPQPIPGAFPPNVASWSRDGRIVFDCYDPSVDKNQIYVVNSDGTNLHRISSGGISDYFPNWSSDNFHIVFERVDPTSGHYQLYSMTSSGGTVTLLSDGTHDEYTPQWSPDASLILFRRGNPSTGHNELWRMNANGSSPTLIYNSTDTQNFAMHPNSSRIAFAIPSGTDEYITLIGFPSLLPLGPLIARSGDQYLPMGWSPDGSRILYLKSSSGLRELDSNTTDGNNESPLASFGDNTAVAGAWEPYPNPIPYVSSTGGYAVNNASSGFIYGLNGNTFASFLNFTATTPTSTTLTVDPITNGSTNLIYHIHGDALTSIKYINGFGGGLNSVSLVPAVQHALVSFNANDGTIGAVLTLSAKTNSTISGPSTLKGSFTGVWNAKGVNLAPHGASQVVLSKTGEIASAR